MSLHAIGITAEYNPFHNGHRWQLQTLREKSGNVPVIACMSGWFVQRGEIAAVDPWIRASMAVHAGVDLVVLLPAWYTLRSADYFAAGAVKTLAATGAAWSLLPETEQQIKTLLQQGLSYGAAWETAASQSQKDAGWFKGANNLLALAYQKALLHNHLAIELITLPRQGSGYNDTELRPPYASASAIRTALRNGVSAAELAPFLPDTSLALLQCREINYPARFARQEDILSQLLSDRLARQDGNYLYEHSSASQDLCCRFYNARQRLQRGFTAFCQTVANKRDPLPSVRRLALQLLLQRSRAFWTISPEPAYIRVLAFNERGRSLLKEMKETASLPVIIKPGREEQYKDTSLYPLLQLDSAAADLFQLLIGNTGTYGSCFTTSPVYVKQT